MKQKIKKIAEKYDLSLIILFGSVAKGFAHEESDVDVAILEKKSLSLHKELDLRADLYKLFRRDVDLVFIRRASPLVLGQISKYGKLLYGTKFQFTEFRIYGMKQYIDFEPYFTLREKLISRNIARLHA